MECTCAIGLPKYEIRRLYKERQLWCTAEFRTFVTGNRVLVTKRGK